MSNLLGVYSRETFKMWYNGVILNRKVDRRDAQTSGGLGSCAGGTITMSNHTLDASSVKVCSCCGESKSLTEYHRHRDGLRPACKSCTNAQNRSIYQKNKESHLASKRRYRAENYESWLETVRAYDSRNEMKRRAHRAVKHAIRSGRMLPVKSSSCARCGGQAEIYHHHSYAPECWLDVEPVCRECHGKEHRDH